MDEGYDVRREAVAADLRESVKAELEELFVKLDRPRPSDKLLDDYTEKIVQLMLGE